MTADDTRPDEGPDREAQWAATNGFSPSQAAPPAPEPGEPITDLAGKVYGYWPTTDPRTAPPAPAVPVRCNCATFGNAALCPFHTQADFDAAAPAVPVTAPDDTLRREVERLRALLDRERDASAHYAAAYDEARAALAAREDADQHGPYCNDGLPMPDDRTYECPGCAREDADQGARAQVAAVEAEIRRYTKHGTPVGRQVAEHFRAALARDTAEPGAGAE